jgi:5-methylcytosine-specific restriction endonuclease McrA
MWSLKEVPICGTARGYDYHTRQLGQSPCEPCRDAKRLQWREKRERNRDSLNAWRRANRKANGRTQYEKDSAARRDGQFVGDYSHATVLETYGAVCHLCNELINLNAPRQVGRPGWERGFHIDHIIPISRGGADELANVRPAHGYCNQTKGAKC